MISHKPVIIYMGGLILGVNTLYRLFCFFELFPMVGKGLNESSPEISSKTMSNLSASVVSLLVGEGHKDGNINSLEWNIRMWDWKQVGMGMKCRRNGNRAR